MSASKSFAKNSLLSLGSVLLVFLCTLVADRVIGALVGPPQPPNAMELIFPPHAEHTYASVDFQYTVHINSLGLRDREIARDRGDAYRIAALGDSYTYGWGVEIEQTWLRQVEERLRGAGFNVETINLGKPGVGPPFYADLADRALPILRPDLVLVAMLMGNDLADAGPELVEEKRNRVLDTVRAVYPNMVRVLRDMRLARDWENRTQDIMPPQKSTAEDNRRWTANTAKDFLEKMSPEHRARFDAFDEEVKSAFLSGNLNPYMIDLAMQNPRFYSLNLDLEDPWTKTCIERTAAQLKRIKNTAEEFGARVIVLSIPDGPYVNENAFKSIQRVGYEVPGDLLDSGAPDRGLEMACQRAGLPFLVVTEAFKDRRNDPGLYFELDGHLTPAGHKLLAEAVAPILEKDIAATLH